MEPAMSLPDLSNPDRSSLKQSVKTKQSNGHPKGIIVMVTSDDVEEQKPKKSSPRERNSTELQLLSIPDGSCTHNCRRHSYQVDMNERHHRKHHKRSRKGSYPETELYRGRVVPDISSDTLSTSSCRHSSRCSSISSVNHSRRSSHSDCGSQRRASCQSYHHRRSSHSISGGSSHSRRPSAAPSIAKEEQNSPENRRRRTIIFLIGFVSCFILLTSVILIAVSLTLSPTIDELVRKENEEMFRGLTSSGTSTSTEAETNNQTMIPSTVHPS
ncbi:uncharacterized protein LOC111627079 [Centruroides sculpturatus]|uniref:uncharacterized protein LOC111627079 n=1 Tax=Centruroides sculpturatus TaxID=218467 RepID=UPI000C6D3CBC|nr:uncharacterized protein LOC111627079 [Centruroides sculpturatus]